MIYTAIFLIGSSIAMIGLVWYCVHTVGKMLEDDNRD